MNKKMFMNWCTPLNTSVYSWEISHQFSQCRNVLDDKEWIFTAFNLQLEQLNVDPHRASAGSTAQKPSAVTETPLPRSVEVDGSNAPLQWKDECWFLSLWRRESPMKKWTQKTLKSHTENKNQQPHFSENQCFFLAKRERWFSIGNAPFLSCCDLWRTGARHCLLSMTRLRSL